MVDAPGLQRIARQLPLPWLIVSDLDGTLLDHHDYSHEPADALLSALEARQIPVVFNTSKTRAELMHLRSELHNRHPFIVENGSAIYIPRNYFAGEIAGAEQVDDFHCIRLGRSRQDILHWLEKAREQQQAEFRSFSEMGLAGIMAATGLDEQSAARASEREFSEAIQWQGSRERREAFCQAAQAAGFKTLVGGRFLHILGNSDKGAATRRLAQEYGRGGQAPSVIAAGDGNNDVQMLEAADLAIAIRSPVNDFPALSPQCQALRSTACGPAGWAEVIGGLLAGVSSSGQEVIENSGEAND